MCRHEPSRSPRLKRVAHRQWCAWSSTPWSPSRWARPYRALGTLELGWMPGEIRHQPQNAATWSGDGVDPLAQIDRLPVDGLDTLGAGTWLRISEGPSVTRKLEPAGGGRGACGRLRRLCRPRSRWLTASTLAERRHRDAAGLHPVVSGLVVGLRRDAVLRRRAPGSPRPGSGSERSSDLDDLGVERAAGGAEQAVVGGIANEGMLEGEPVAGAVERVGRAPSRPGGSSEACKGERRAARQRRRADRARTPGRWSPRPGPPAWPRPAGPAERSASPGWWRESTGDGRRARADLLSCPGLRSRPGPSSAPRRRAAHRRWRRGSVRGARLDSIAPSDQLVDRSRRFPHARADRPVTCRTLAGLTQSLGRSRSGRRSGRATAPDAGGPISSPSHSRVVGSAQCRSSTTRIGRPRAASAQDVLAQTSRACGRAARRGERRQGRVPVCSIPSRSARTSTRSGSCSRIEPTQPLQPLAGASRRRRSCAMTADRSINSITGCSGLSRSRAILAAE